MFALCPQDLKTHPEDVVLEHPPEPLKLKQFAGTSDSSWGQQEPGGSAAAGTVDNSNTSSNTVSAGRPRPRQLPCVEPDDGGEDWEAERVKHRAALQEKWGKAAAAAAASKAASEAQVRGCSGFLSGLQRYE
jgi:hypothetical protein